MTNFEKQPGLSLEEKTKLSKVIFIIDEYVLQLKNLYNNRVNFSQVNLNDMLEQGGIETSVDFKIDTIKALLPEPSTSDSIQSKNFEDSTLEKINKIDPNHILSKKIEFPKGLGENSWDSLLFDLRDTIFREGYLVYWDEGIKPNLSKLTL